MHGNSFCGGSYEMWRFTRDEKGTQDDRCISHNGSPQSLRPKRLPGIMKIIAEKSERVIQPVLE